MNNKLIIVLIVVILVLCIMAVLKSRLFRKRSRLLQKGNAIEDRRDSRATRYYYETENDDDYYRWIMMMVRASMMNGDDSSSDDSSDSSSSDSSSSDSSSDDSSSESDDDNSNDIRPNPPTIHDDLYDAIERGDYDFCINYINRNIDCLNYNHPIRNGDTPLIHVLRYSNNTNNRNLILPIVQLSDHASIIRSNDEGFSALEYAAFYGYYDVVRGLIDHGALSMPAKAYHAMNYARQANHEEIAQYIQRKLHETYPEHY